LNSRLDLFHDSRHGRVCDRDRRHLIAFHDRLKRRCILHMTEPCAAIDTSPISHVQHKSTHDYHCHVATVLHRDTEGFEEQFRERVGPLGLPSLLASGVGFCRWRWRGPIVVMLVIMLVIVVLLVMTLMVAVVLMLPVLRPRSFG
jgi:hypothetical protein